MRRLMIGILIALCWANESYSTASAQSPPVNITTFEELQAHQFEPQAIFRTPWTDLSASGYDNQGVWTFEITVDEAGAVSSAKPVRGPKTSDATNEKALAAVMAARFKPFERDGKPVRAKFEYYVEAKPEDYSGPQDRAFPARVNLDDVVMRLKRTSCFGTCPSYQIEIRGDGRVTYTGDEGRSVLVEGVHRWRIPQSDVAILFDMFRRADYFQLDGYYEAPVTDLPTFVTQLSIGTRRKFVLNYGAAGGFGGAFASTSLGGAWPDMPLIVSDIENAIDRIAGTSSWVHGDMRTIPLLRAERWNFHSKAAAKAMVMLLVNCQTTLARSFLDEGAPVISESFGWFSAFDDGPISSAVFAARCDDVDLVRLLVSKGALDSKRHASEFLQTSAESGNTEMVKIALGHDRNVNFRNEDGASLLMIAAQSFSHREDDDESDPAFDSAGVIELLLAAGANPRAADDEGNTPLHEVNRASAARALLKGGADPNARNAEGQTPIFSRYFADAKRVILEAGADVAARDNHGRTALFYQDSTEVAKVLIDAGVDLNAVDEDGKSALEFIDAEDVALALLNAGVNLPRDPARLSALIDRARSRRWPDVLRALQDRAPKS